MATLITDPELRQAENTMQARAILEPPELTIPKKQFALEQLSFLLQLGTVNNEILVIERSFRGYRLKNPVQVPVCDILAVGEVGLCEYIFRSLIPTRPLLIGWVLHNRTLIEVASYLFRARSKSKMGFYGTVNTVHLYCERLNAEPDKLLGDVVRNGLPDPARIEKHRTFLQSCLNELDDMKRSPGRIGGYAKQVRLFYRVNNVELPRPKFLPKPRVVSKHRSPTMQELREVLRIADLREKLLVLLPATSGFREGTVSLLKYRHVKTDLENNVVPVHVHIEADETKGQYSDFDTFLSGETVEVVNLYLDRRRRGSAPRKDSPLESSTQKIPPEEITDNSPLIRDSQSVEPRPVGEKQIYRLAHNLFHRAGLSRKNKHGQYELTFHSLRKFFETEMKPRGVKDPDLIQYWMGHVVSVYNDIQSKGIEYQRGEYAKANLRIQPEAGGTGNIALFKKMAMEMARELGVNPEEVIANTAKPHRINATPEEQDQLETSAIIKAFAQHIKDQFRESSSGASAR